MIFEFSPKKIESENVLVFSHVSMHFQSCLIEFSIFLFQSCMAGWPSSQSIKLYIWSLIWVQVRILPAAVHFFGENSKNHKFPGDRASVRKKG